MINPMNKNKNDVGPRGFKLTRVTTPSSYDPMEGIRWQPEKESDELYDALKRAFPGRKTHRERMCEALMQFLAEELGGASKDRGLETKSSTKALQVSSPPLKRVPPMVNDTIQPVEKRQKTDRAWADMTVVWKSDTGLTKGARPRRMMNEDERADYRMRRVRGACVACKRKKRKCNHDRGPSPASSSENASSSPPTPTPPLRFRRLGEDQDELAADVVLSKQVQQSEDLEAVSMSKIYEKETQPSLPSPPKHVQPLDKHYQLPPTSDMSPYHDWHQHESALLGPQKQMYNHGSVNSFPALVYDPLLADIWDMNTFDLNENMSFDHPAYDILPISNMLHAASMPVGMLDSVALKHAQRTFSDVAGADIPTPVFAHPDNTWAQAQGQAHVEQWLDQKVMGECSVPADLEPAPYHDHAQDQQTVTSSTRRRVKFDFASLIDGPPTLSTSPAEFFEETNLRAHGTQVQQATDRSPRSTSRHSTASRLSFSDIISLSSALTSLSMKDGESRRGSNHSAISEGVLDGAGDNEDAEYPQRGWDGSDHTSGSSASEDALDDIVDWTQWNTRRNQEVLSL